MTQFLSLFVKSNDSGHPAREKWNGDSRSGLGGETVGSAFYQIVETNPQVMVDIRGILDTSQGAARVSISR